MFEFIAKPFGVIMEFIYNNLAFQNYGLAIIVFTLFVKILLLPLNVKQQRSMARQQALAPELEAIKNKYNGDNKKIQEEQMNLYSKYKINPYSGCLPTLLQFPIIIAVYTIIRSPLSYIAKLSKATITALADKAKEIAEAASQKVGSDQISVNTFFRNGYVEQFTEIANCQPINMTFLKIFDLGLVPRVDFWAYGSEWKTYLPLLLIPLLAVASSYLQMWITNLVNNGPKKKKEDGSQPGMQGLNGVMKLMPLMTLVIGFMVPAGLGFYWIVSNVFGILQTILIKKLFTMKKKEGSV